MEFQAYYQAEAGRRINAGENMAEESVTWPGQ